MKVKSTIQVNKRFDKLIRDYGDAVEDALQDAAKVAASTASGQAAQRTQTGAMADIRYSRPLPLRGARHGADVVIYSNPYYATFHNWGTLGSRTRKLKQPGRRKANPDNPGLKPLYFMEKGRTAGRKALMAALAVHIRQVK